MFGLALLALLLAVPLALTLSVNAHHTAAAAAGTVVEIKNISLDPRVATVKAGGTVTWKNEDTRSYEFVADDGSFDTGVIRPGSSASHTSPKAKSIPYHDKLRVNVRGTITVTP
jgi:plastocyanin